MMQPMKPCSISKQKKSQTISSYKHDEVLIKTQTRNRIKVAYSDQEGEFLSNDLTWH